MLVSNERVWLIDHGAALFFHHRWPGWRDRIQSPFAQIADHVLLHVAGDLQAADARLSPSLDEAKLRDIVQAVPEDWFTPIDDDSIATAEQQREAYVTYLVERLTGPRAWLAQAKEAQAEGPKTLQRRLTHRVV
jgi:hypothetical protein